MFIRSLKLSKKYSFFLFGARNTGKTTLIKHSFAKEETLFIDLLNINEEERFLKNPQELESIVLELPKNIKYIVLDEIQKIPKLLDVVHSLIEKTNKIFILSGSSARKLKYGGANLLAGRAFVYNLFPLTSFEIGEQFSLSRALNFGMLPSIYEMETDEDRIKFLQAYSHTYLKEEIILEQLVRKIDPFRKFLEVSAQSNGKIINIASIARDVGVDDKTVSQYYSILEDTLIGFYLEPFVNSFRKRLSQKPKFYFFDTGVTKSLIRSLSLFLQESTSAYGEAFEHFIILECIKNASYYFLEYRFSYLKTKDDAEVDLVVERPGKPLLFIEIKSSIMVNIENLSSLSKIIKDFKDYEAVCFCRDTVTKKINNIKIMPWQEGIKEFFTKTDLNHI